MVVLGREVVIVEAVRTPIGRGHREKGEFRDVHPATLLAATYTELLAAPASRARRSTTCSRAACSSTASSRSTSAGTRGSRPACPYETPATTIDRQCGSAQQAVNFGATLIASGVHDVTIGSGVESMGRIPMFVGRKFDDEVGSPFTPELLEHYDLIDQGFSAEMIAEQWSLSRERLDEIGARSQQRAERARDRGALRPRDRPDRGQRGVVTTDQGIRPGTTVETPRRAEAGVQGGRHDHGGQLVADLGRRRGGAARLRARPPTRSACAPAQGSSTRRRSASTP